MKVSILGTEYTIQKHSKKDDKYLETCDGYCDKTSKRIVVNIDNGDLDDFDVYIKKVLRHEIIHAFLYESGLWENFKHDTWGHDETMVDWVAVQFPKILNVFAEVDCL